MSFGRQRAQRARRSPGWTVRVAAAFAALLLLASSLGQVAHFLLVQHAICAEHGELLEVHGAEHPASATITLADSDEQAHASAPDLEGEHDHCQHLARRQSELAVFTGATEALVIPPPAATLPKPSLAAEPRASHALLALAPKTSPPRHPACG
jgi:hypothetical protein